MAFRDTQSTAQEPRTILITGGAGFIGSNLCEKLLEEGHRVCALDNLITGYRENIKPYELNERFNFVEEDICQAAFTERLSDIKFDEIYHLACPTGVPNIAPDALGEEIVRTCSIGTINVLELAKRMEAKVLFTSTAEVYGDPQVLPQPETYVGNVNPVGPRCTYEEGKRFSETLVITYVGKYNLNARIVRIFNTYGPKMSLQDHRVHTNFLNKIKQGKPLIIYGDGSQTRTHCFVHDTIRGLQIAMAKGVPGEVYNVGGSERLTIKQLAEKVIEISKTDQKIEYVPHFIEDHMNRQPETSKIQALGWQQLTSLEEGLKLILVANGFPKILVPTPKVPNISNVTKF